MCDALTAVYPDNVEPAGPLIRDPGIMQIKQRCIRYPALFIQAYCFERRSGTIAFSEFNFNKYDRTAVSGYDIYLAEPRPEVPGEYPPAKFLQITDSHVFIY